MLYRDPPSLVELPLASLQPGRRIRLPAPPDDFDLSPETDSGAIVTRSNSSIVIVSLSQAAILRTIQAATEPSIARFRFDGRQLIAGSQADRSLTIYDVALGKTVVRLPSFESVSENPVMYAHASRVFHLESNPGNARAIVQRHGARDVWINPPPIPLTTAEMDHVFDLAYARSPHPRYAASRSCPLALRCHT